jgi:azurin
MGHNWVLARTSDVAAIASAGVAAGFDHSFQATGDKRIIAATHIVGGGESTTVKFSAAALQPGADYTFFCSSPGHSSMMRGKFVFGEPTGRLAATSSK